MMAPYVGKNFGKPSSPSLLLIGESHYVEEDFPGRVSDAWYAGCSTTLCQQDIEWISTAPILEESRIDAFSNKAHSIWSNSFWEINQHGPRYEDYLRLADDIAFYNFFLRPAVDGSSLKYELSSHDIEAANEAFLFHYNRLKPSAVVFLSMLAYDRCRHTVTVPVIATPHPGCAHWNTVRAKYDDRRGRDILADFIRIETTWPKSLTSE